MCETFENCKVLQNLKNLSLNKMSCPSPLSLESEGNTKIIYLKQVNFVVCLLYLNILVNKIKNYLLKVKGKEGSEPKFGDGGAVLLLLRRSGRRYVKVNSRRLKENAAVFQRKFLVEDVIKDTLRIKCT